MKCSEEMAFTAIKKHFISKHNMPTYRQLSERLNISPQMAKIYFEKLVDSGKLKRKGMDFSFNNYKVELHEIK